MSSPLISIVAPVFNNEKYLNTFIESVLSQTYTNWEFLLIDDGSTDGSAKICDDYKQKDERIHVLHKTNGGVSSARNAGIREAKGTWLLLPDADDYLCHDALRVLLSYARDDVDLIGAGYIRNVLGKNVPEKKPSETKKMSVSEYVEVIGIIPQARNTDRYCWNKMFRMSVIKENKVIFDEEVFYREDILFIYQYLKHCSHYIQCVSYSMYIYYMRDSGAAISLQKVYSRKSGDRFIAMSRCYEILGQMDVPVIVKNRMKEEILSAFKALIKLILDTGVEIKDIRLYYTLLLRYFSRWDLFVIVLKRLFVRL